MLLWAIWIVPGMLDVFSLPPFLDDLEFGLLLQGMPMPHACPSTGMGILAFGSRAGAAACPLTAMTCPGPPIGHQRHTCRKGASGTSWDSTSGFRFLASSQ